MRFLLLIYNEEVNGCTGTPELFEEMGAFNAELIAEGVREAGEALEPIVTARTIRVRGDRVSSTDGPFAETKEQLGGFYMLDCVDMDETCVYAARLPAARFGSIEVRPIMEISFDS
jgi:hypothetical protein